MWGGKNALPTFPPTEVNSDGSRVGAPEVVQPKGEKRDAEEKM